MKWTGVTLQSSKSMERNVPSDILKEKTGYPDHVNFSSKTIYAIQMLVDMATYETYGNVKIKDVSNRQGISTKYLEQIISVLAKAGYVKGERGPQGGYRLGISSGNLTIGMIVRSMEGDVSSAPTIDPSIECPWIPRCVEKGLWSRIDTVVNEILDNTTIEDLVNLAKKEGMMDVPDSPEYYI